MPLRHAVLTTEGTSETVPKTTALVREEQTEKHAKESAALAQPSPRATTPQAITFPVTTTPMILAEGSTRTLRYAYSQASGTEALFPQASSLIKVALLGLVWGAATCGMFLINQKSFDTMMGTVPGFATETAIWVLGFLLLSGFIAFLRGWQQRNGTRGAITGVVFGITIILGFLGCLAMLASLLMANNSGVIRDTFHLVPFFALFLVVVLGAFGGACGRASQARRARSSKANR